MLRFLFFSDPFDRKLRRGLVAVLVVLSTSTVVSCASVGRAASAVVPRRVEFLGEARIPSLEIEGARLGGLSGVTWVRGDEYLAVTDDKGEFGPPRFYRLSVRVQDDAGRVERRPRVEVLGWIGVRQADGNALAAERTDLEGIAARGTEEVLVSSEGWGERGVPPFVTWLSADGSWRQDLPLPDGFAPAADGGSGVRSNLAFESLTVTQDRRYLFTATENALLQDGPASDAGISSPSRLLRYDLAVGKWDRQWLYRVEPPRFRPQPGASRVAGLVDLAALDENHLLALERSFEKGHGYDERLFALEIGQADDVAARFSLREAPLPRPVRKRLLLDLRQLGIRLDNLEGMAIGRTLRDGRRLLVLVSDDNYKTGLQVNQVLVFALTLAVP